MFVPLGLLFNVTFECRTYSRVKLHPKRVQPSLNIVWIAIMEKIIQTEWIQEHIYFFRGCKVILSHDLAKLYNVEPKVLIQTVKRNLDRFPSDFLFQLKNQEFTNLKSQSVTSSWGGLRKPPYAFTEQGIAMLSGLLNSRQAIQVNIEIMRTFVSLRKLINSNKEFSDKLNQMELKYEHQFKVVFDALREVMNPPIPAKRRIGIWNLLHELGPGIGSKFVNEENLVNLQNSVIFNWELPIRMLVWVKVSNQDSGASKGW